MDNISSLSITTVLCSKPSRQPTLSGWYGPSNTPPVYFGNTRITTGSTLSGWQLNWISNNPKSGIAYRVSIYLAMEALSLSRTIIKALSWLLCNPCTLIGIFGSILFLGMITIGKIKRTNASTLIGWESSWTYANLL